MNALDSIELSTLAERLRNSRSAAGLTQGHAAEAVGMARTTLVAIESAQRRVRPHELIALADLYRVSTNQLLRRTTIQLDLVPRFRRTHVAETPADASSDAVRLLNDLVAASVELESLLGKSFQTHYPPPLRITPGDIDQQAEDAALSLRAYLGLGFNPIPDVVSLLELELGIRVFLRPLHSTISGVFGYSSDAGAAILLNSKHPRTRRAQTGAHETGHFIGSRDSVDVFVEGASRTSRDERFATVFGLAFLMPPPAIRRRFHEICTEESRFSARHVILMAHAFHVSPEAMCRWLETLKLLPRGSYDSLRERGFSAANSKAVLGDRASEDFATPPRLALLAAEAYDSGLLSEGQLSEMLRMDRVELRHWLDALGGQGAEPSSVLP